MQETGLMGSGRSPKAMDPGTGRLKTEVPDLGQRGAKGWEPSDNVVILGKTRQRRLPQRWASQALGGAWRRRGSNRMWGGDPMLPSHAREAGPQEEEGASSSGNGTVTHWPQ